MYLNSSIMKKREKWILNHILHTRHDFICCDQISLYLLDLCSKSKLCILLFSDGLQPCNYFSCHFLYLYSALEYSFCAKNCTKYSERHRLVYWHYYIGHFTFLIIPNIEFAFFDSSWTRNGIFGVLSTMTLRPCPD